MVELLRVPRPPLRAALAHPTADNVKVVLRVRPSTSADSTWAVTAKEDGGPSLQLLDAKGVPVTTYGLGA